VNSFPSSFQSLRQKSMALYHLAMWSGGSRAPVWVPQFASLRNHVREIARTPAGARVEMLSRLMGMWPDSCEVSATLPAADAASLMCACLEEAPALLELGYPSGEGLDFVTRMPPPGANGRRTPAQMRAAVHHLGGDFDLLRSMMSVPDPFAPCLRAVFSVWPRFSPPGDNESLLLQPAGRLGTCLTYRRDLRGYCLLCCYDLALRLKASEGVPPVFDSFAEFADQVS
jgi:hypothetical protein